ncbi:hypothetical protein ABZ805_17595 [Saccharopolyspora sp. NPDC047091]|uniref:hypothetical protein n=1 Tax=Saccharopolyspora sp. NPDC047091 TaxID=3155924 RepID=UPI0033D238E8
MVYSERYSDLAGKPTGPLSEEQARERHASGEPYAVTLGDPGSPDAVIDVAWKNDHLGVWFFDEKVRRTVHFSFQARESKLFLTTVMNWKYPDDARLRNQASVIERVSYNPDGIIQHEVIDKVAEEKTVRDISDVDVTMNWENIPSFGEWDSVSRFDRKRPT